MKKGEADQGAPATLKLNPHAKAVADMNSILSHKLHQLIRECESGNVVFSPFAVATLLSMVKQGAKEATATELDNVLDTPCKNEHLLKGFSQIIESLEGVLEEDFLALANKLFLLPGFVPKKQFTEALKKYFQVEIQQLDFSRLTSIVTAETKVNRWVEKATKNRIQQIVKPDEFTQGTKIVLAGAAYFTGVWKYPFSQEQTTPTLFYVNAMATAEVDMMYSRCEYFPYAILPELDAEAVALPCKGDRLWMVVYVPRQRTGLKKIETNIRPSAPAEVLSQSPFDIILFLPKFKIESNIVLSNHLEWLGVTSLFRETESDLSGITKEARMSVSNTIHKAVIEVNESGTESAGTTTPFPEFTCLPPMVHADRPFYFQVYDTQTSVILLSGSVLQPQTAQPRPCSVSL